MLNRAAWMALCVSGLFVMPPFKAGASQGAPTQSVTLKWSPSTATNVVGYDIYYGGENGEYTNEVAVGNVTNASVSGLIEGATYYFAAKAYNASGVESPFSNQTSYTVPTAAAMLILPSASTAGFSFSVNGPSGYSYVIQTSTNMVNWVPIATNIAPFLFVDSNTSQFKQKFYRSIYTP
ncbi:MAG TPA: fibronectin type III domain-containing protein [Verrucomicrobiae bacterium]|nr:fibronectin type III domain-containing protein [Verrucomicrobiae bacterium]